MIAKDTKVLLGGYNISGDSNRAMVSSGRTQEPDSRFGDDTEVFANGVRRVDVSVEGFYRSALDAVLRGKFDAGNSLVTVFQRGTTLGDDGEAIRAHVGEYGSFPDATWGKQLRFTFRAYTLSRRYGARLLASGVKLATGVGAALQIVGGVSSGKKLYGGVHVVGVAGTDPTLDVTVQSAPTADFAAPTTRITHPQKTAIGDALSAGVSGPIADEYFRLAWTVGGSNAPSFEIFGWLAIQR